MVVTVIAEVVYIIVGFSMDRELTNGEDKLSFESLEDWCEFMLKLCDAKVINDEAPIMSKAAPYIGIERGFWGDEKYKGTWLKCENMVGMGESVSL